VLRQAVEEHPAVQDLRLAYAGALLAQHEIEQAYAQYEKALAIGPRDAEIEFTAGTVANMAGMVQRAQEHYAAAQTADMTDPRYPLYLGQIQLKLGQTDEARVSLLRAVHLDPDQPVAWGTLAQIALQANRVGLALRHVAKARKLEPDVLTWRLIEARALKREGKVEPALTLLLALDEQQRYRPDVLRVIGECYGLMRRPADAAANYVKASDANPTDKDLAFDAAVWQDRAGDKAAALKLAQRAARLGHEDAGKLVARLKAKPDDDGG
jgi:tetratricopeptide (TPR) repeat protein